MDLTTHVYNKGSAHQVGLIRNKLPMYSQLLETFLFLAEPVRSSGFLEGFERVQTSGFFGRTWVVRVSSTCQI